MSLPLTCTVGGEGVALVPVLARPPLALCGLVGVVASTISAVSVTTSTDCGGLAAGVATCSLAAEAAAAAFVF